MAYRNEPRDLEYDDDDKLDMMPQVWPVGMPMPEPPDYPPWCCFSITEDELERIAGPNGEPGAMLDFAAMATVTSCVRGRTECRVELEITDLAGGDGKFVKLERPSHICFQQAELDKMDLEADCEVGDMIHLIGVARLESVERTRGYPDMGVDGAETARLQITRLTWEENESSESRGG